MNKVIALSGKSNIGKTSTLKLFIDMLTDKYSPSNIEYHIDRQDVRVIYTILSVKVGIETQGDPRSRLPCSLKLFRDEGCKIIVCASRSSGATVDAVNSLQPSYTASFRGQSEVSLEEWRENSNATMALMILDEVSEALNA